MTQSYNDNQSGYTRILLVLIFLLIAAGAGYVIFQPGAPSDSSPDPKNAGKSSSFRKTTPEKDTKNTKSSNYNDSSGKNNQKITINKPEENQSDQHNQTLIKAKEAVKHKKFQKAAKLYNKLAKETDQSEQQEIYARKRKRLLYKYYFSRANQQIKETEAPSIENLKDIQSLLDQALSYRDQKEARKIQKRISQKIKTKKKEKRKKKREELKRLFAQAQTLWKKHKYEPALKKLEEIQSIDVSSPVQEKARKRQEEWTQKRKLFDLWIKKAKSDREKEKWTSMKNKIKTALDYMPDHPDGIKLLQHAKKQIIQEQMVEIPAGQYRVGSSDVPGNPSRKVQTDGFYIDRKEVSNQEYKQFLAATNYPTAPPGWQSRDFPEGKANHPVEGVRYEDARAYARWADKRLPTEQEWEIATRGRDSNSFPWGTEAEHINERANTLEAQESGTVAVSTYKKGKSPFGLFHTIGNVAEWTRTKIHLKEQDETTTFSVVKGGSYLFPLSKSLPSKRFLYDPKSQLKGIGFRCARDLQNND